MVIWAAIASFLEGSTYFGEAVASPPIPSWVVASQYSIAAMAAALAMVLAWRLPTQIDAKALSLHLALLAVAHALLIDGAGSPSRLHRLTFSVTGSGAIAAFVAFTRVFPQPIERFSVPQAQLAVVLDRTTVWTALLAIPYAGLLYFTYASYGDEYGMMLVERYVPGARVAVGLIAVGFVAAISVGVRGLWQSYAGAGDSGRRRILIVVAGYIFSFFALLAMASLVGLALLTGSRPLVAFSTWASYVLWPIAVLPALAALFAAVFFTRAFDPTLAIRRTAVYGTLFVAMTFVFAGLEELITSQITQRFGLPDLAGTWIAGGAVALVVGPVRDMLDRAVRRRTRFATD